MIARNHWKCSLGAWLIVGGAAEVAGLLPPGATIGLSPVAAGAGLGPDLDFPPQGGKPGATAAEAHGLASNALSLLISKTHGGHRGLTHRYRYALFVGALVLVLGWRWPLQTTLGLVAWWTAWPLYCSLPRAHRWASAFLAVALALVMYRCEWAPETVWVAAVAALGWAMHIACDHFQSGITKAVRRAWGRSDAAEVTLEWFGLGSPGETCIAWGSLLAGLTAWSFLTTPHPFS